jgi:hypothetical protein
MATAHHTLLQDGRRPPIVPLSVPPEIRARITGEIRSLLDRAEALIDFLNAADAPLLDLEPDADGEAEPDEASAQPLTLAPDRANVVQMPRRLRHVEGITSAAPIDWAASMPAAVHRPSNREMRRAYRETGAPVPANLRFDIFGRPRA